MSEDFIPKMIGSKDEKAYENIEGLYQAMTTNADNFVQEIRDLLNDQKLSPEENIGIIFQFCQQSAKELCTTTGPSTDSFLTALLS